MFKSLVGLEGFNLKSGQHLIVPCSNAAGSFIEIM